MNDPLSVAYRYLSRRDRTVVEVRAHLEKKGVEEDAAEAAIAELVEQRYLDDARYARQFAEDRRTLDGWGAERIGRKLSSVGVEREHVEAALASLDDLGAASPAGSSVDLSTDSSDAPSGELGAAIAVLRKRFREPPSTDRERERALGVLARRGYELEVAYDAVRAFARDAA